MRMTLLLLPLLLSSLLTAQEARYGILLEQNFSTVASAPHTLNAVGAAEAFRSRSSWNIGLVSLHPLSEHIAVQTSVVYSNKVVEAEWAGPADGPVEAVLHFGYLSLSPKLQVFLFDGLFLNAGPSLDIKVDTKLEQRGAYVNDQDEVSSSNALRFGAVCSAGFMVPLVNGVWLAPAVSYDLGVTNTNDAFGKRYSSVRAGVQVYFR